MKTSNPPIYVAKPKTALALSLLTGMLLAFYIFQVNAMTAQVYRIGDSERALRQLRVDSVGFETLHAPSLSRANMEKLARDLSFERIKTVSYLRIPTNTVARTDAVSE